MESEALEVVLCVEESEFVVECADVSPVDSLIIALAGVDLPALADWTSKVHILVQVHTLVGLIGHGCPGVRGGLTPL